MNSPEIKAFIRKHSALFRYIPEDKKEEISEDVLVTCKTKAKDSSGMF